MWSALARGGRIAQAVVSRSWPATKNPLRVSGVQIPTIVSALSSAAPNVAIRPFSSYSPSPLDAFRDTVDRQSRASESVGRSWSVQELRRKSYEDLHKLWYVLYKEKNMLLTEQQLSRRRQLIFPQPQRVKKVQKSMQAIKQVLGERKRRKIAEHHANKQMEQALHEESMDMDDIEVKVEK